jgi:hypothetical protein
MFLQAVPERVPRDSQDEQVTLGSTFPNPHSLETCSNWNSPRLFFLSFEKIIRNTLATAGCSGNTIP